MQNEEKYRLLVENIPDVLWTADQCGHTTFISPQVKKVCGYTPEEIYENDKKGASFWFEMIHPDDADSVKDAYKALFESNRMFDIRYRLRRKGGGRVWVHDKAITVYKKDGVAYAEGILRDITAYKEAEDKVDLLLTITKAIAESQDFHTALDITIRKVCEVTGWDYGEVWCPSSDGKRLERLLSCHCISRDLEEFSEKCKEFTFEPGMGMPGRVWLSKKPEWRKDATVNSDFPRAGIAKKYGLKAAMGIPVVARSKVIAVLNFFVRERRDEDEQLISFVSSIAVQIGVAIQRKQAEDALYRAEQELLSILENAPLVIYAKDMQGRYMFINKQDTYMFGIKRGELIGRTDRECLPERVAEMYAANDKKVVETKMPMSFEEEAMQDDGLHTYISTKFPLIASDGEIFAVGGVSIDVTRQKQMEEEQGKLQEQLYHSQNLASVGKLAGGVAHSFNNILTVITGYASMLCAETTEDSPFRMYAEKILKSSKAAADVTMGLLAFSRKQPICPTLVDINEVIKDAESFLSKLIREDVSLTTILTAMDTTVMADVGQVEQILMNLTTNARDAMPNGGELIIRTDIVEMDDIFIQSCGYGRAGKYVHISVADTGVGMNEETRRRLFEPFFTTKAAGKGTGLGLASVYGIVKQHAGYINVYSSPGKGARFNIYLPLVESEVRHSSTEPQTNAPRGGNETILLAEDEPDVRELVKKILEYSGYRVIEAADGEDALYKFMKYKDVVQLLVSDLIMPKKNGMEAYEAIRKIQPGVKAVFITGYDDDVISKMDNQFGKINYLLKPITQRMLLEKVREVLDK